MNADVEIQRAKLKQAKIQRNKSKIHTGEKKKNTSSKSQTNPNREKAQATKLQETLMIRQGRTSNKAGEDTGLKTLGRGRMTRHR